MKKVFCKICDKETIYSRQTFAKHHLIKEHGLTSRDYYDRFKIEEKEGLCKICGKPTFFRNIEEGYNEFCSNLCSIKDKDVSDKKVKVRLERERRKYNGKIFLQTKEYVDKVKAIKKKKYGDENYCNAKKIAKTKKRKYGDSSFCNVDKIRKTMMEKYGGYQHLYNQTKKACVKKYGVDNYFKTDEFRKSMELDRKWVPLERLSEYEIYKRRVKKETRKWKKELFSKWDGRDYYTGEKLITYEEWKRKRNGLHVSKNKLQPTIDHKISVVYGFNKDIEPEAIGNIDNLCICSRDINVRKNYQTNEQYDKRR